MECSAAEHVRLKFLECQSPLAVFEHIFSLPEVNKLRAVGLLWKWWDERNKAKQGERRMSAEFNHLITHNVQ